MAALRESEKRDFISQMITLLVEESETLTTEGFNPTEKLAALNEKNTVAEKAEIEQQQIEAKAREATKRANEKLDEAYRLASNMADLISGLLGKENELVKKMRRFRK